MGLFSAEVDLHLKELLFLEGIFHYGRNKFFSWGKLLQPAHLQVLFSQTSQPHHRGAGRKALGWPGGAVKGEGVKPAHPALCSDCTGQGAGLGMTSLMGRATQCLPVADR